MNPYLSNGLVWWDECAIERREAITSRLIGEVRRTIQDMNSAIRFIRVETPCLMPFDWCTNSQLPYMRTENHALRAESTRGTYWVQEHVQFKLPVCIYQINKSFRDEKSEAMRLSHLRLREFYQLEFQLFYAIGTRNDYHQKFVDSFHFQLGVADVEGLLELVPLELQTEELPPYSTRTTDLNIGKYEVASLSTRNDFEVPVFEMSFGLDRLTELSGEA